MYVSFICGTFCAHSLTRSLFEMKSNFHVNRSLTSSRRGVYCLTYSYTPIEWSNNRKELNLNWYVEGESHLSFLGKGRERKLGWKVHKILAKRLKFSFEIILLILNFVSQNSKFLNELKSFWNISKQFLEYFGIFWNNFDQFSQRLKTFPNFQLFLVT